MANFFDININNLETGMIIAEDILNAVLTHHEREDGSGYPLGICGEKMRPFEALKTIENY